LQASDREVVWVLRVAMFFVGAITTVIAVTVKSIVALIILSVDFPYCILFPQLVCVIYLPFANAYGAFTGFIVALFFRMTGGEPFMELPALIKYPWYDEATGIQRFPYKTLTTVLSFVTIITVSWVTRELHRRYQKFRHMDKLFMNAFQENRRNKRKRIDRCENKVIEQEVVTYKVKEDYLDLTMESNERA
jgi:high affinity choline transporter 7